MICFICIEKSLKKTYYEKFSKFKFNRVKIPAGIVREKFEIHLM